MSKEKDFADRVQKLAAYLAWLEYAINVELEKLS